MRRSLIALLVLAMAGTCGCGLLRAKKQPMNLKDCAGLSAALEKAELAESVKGKVLVVLFWTRYNPHFSMQTLPHMKALYANYKDSGLEIVLVNTDRSSNPDEAADFLARERVNFANILDDGSIGKDFAFRDEPIIFDRNGNHVKAGSHTSDTVAFDKKIDELTGEK